MKSRDRFDRLFTNEECLPLVVKVFNGIIGLERLCPTLLVLGTTLPSGGTYTTAPQLPRAEQKEDASNKMGKEIAKEESILQ